MLAAHIQGYSKRAASDGASIRFSVSTGSTGGALRDCFHTIDQATADIQSGDFQFYEEETIRLRGEALLAQSCENIGEAEAAYKEAMAAASRRSCRAVELRASMSLARLWRSQGKVQQARELLAPVYGWFTEGFDTRDLKEAKELLEELGARRARQGRAFVDRWSDPRKCR